MVTKPSPLCLVIEPERGMRLLLDDVLSVSGVQVTVCENETQAKNLYEENPRTNVIVCPAPPAGSKTSVLLQLRGTYPDIPILCLSHSSSLPDRAHAFEQGASEYLLRPVSPVTLADRVIWWAGRAHRSLPGSF
jgi:DNA-binding response OmpR family regulator